MRLRKLWGFGSRSQAMGEMPSPWDRVGDDISISGMLRERLAEKLVTAIAWFAVVIVFVSIELREWARGMGSGRRKSQHERPVLSEKTGRAKPRTIIDEGAL